MNKISILLFVTLLLVTSVASGSTGSLEPADTSNKPWQLKKSDFLKKYGTDDASNNLIRYWFNKRHPLKTATIGSGAVVALTAVPLANALNSGSAWGFGLILLLGGAIISAGIVFLISFPRFISFSRKRLFHLLADLKKGKPLPTKYQKKMPRKFN